MRFDLFCKLGKVTINKTHQGVRVRILVDDVDLKGCDAMGAALDVFASGFERIC